MDVAELYHKAREDYTLSGSLGKVGSFEGLLAQPGIPLEEIATLAARSIETDDYPSRQICFPLADLDLLERLNKEGITHPQELLAAVYHLFEDYLKPEEEQAYRLGPYLRIVIGFVERLGLQDQFDLSYFDRAIEKAIEDGYSTEAANWQARRDSIASAQTGKP